MDWTDPTISFSSTNNFANQQTVTLTLKDNLGISHYYFGKTNPTSGVTYTSVSDIPKELVKTETISDSGTYYFSIKDRAGNTKTISKTYYKTSLVPNRGSVTSNDVLTLSGNQITLPTPSGVTGYGFSGWYKEDAFTNKVNSPYTPAANSTIYGKWVPCGPGKYSNNNQCVDCAAGTYSTEAANSVCTACPSGMTSDTGSDEKTDCKIYCNPGKYLPANTSSCSTCLANNYCPGGTYYFNSSANGGIFGCPGGYGSGAGSSVRSNCSIYCGANTRVASVDARCTNCPGGYEKGAHYVSAGSTSSCSKIQSSSGGGSSDGGSSSGGNKCTNADGCCACSCGCKRCAGCSGCFLAGTKVMTVFGPRDIDQIKAGDLVLSYNVKTNQKEYKLVKRALVHIDFTENWYTLTMDDQSTLRVAEAHSFLIKNTEGIIYLKARELKVGDMVMYIDGNYHTIVKIAYQLENHTEYNLDVEDNDNYYVGDQYILVHNSDDK